MPFHAGIERLRLRLQFLKIRHIYHHICLVSDPNVGDKEPRAAANPGCHDDPVNFSHLYPDSLKSRKKFLAVSDWTDSVSSMIRSGFLSEEDRKALTALARDGSSPCRVTRRANALVLLDEGWSCQQVASRPCAAA